MDLLSDRYRQAMRKVAATVNVVTCEHEQGRRGTIATAVTSVSAEPPAVLVCINRSSSFYDAVSGAQRFCVNVLAPSHSEMTDIFSSRAREAERFVTGAWEDDDGLPYLADAQANLFCRVDRRIEYATHMIFIGLVEKIAFRSGADPLLYLDGQMARSVGIGSCPG